MDIALIGSRWFGAQVLAGLMTRGHKLAVVGIDEADRLVQAAMAADLPCTLLGNRRRMKPEDLDKSVDLIVSAHSHVFIPAEVCAKARIAAIGYHPSLLPRHRGIAAVEWTISSGDAIAGGSVYHLSEEMDAGAIVVQEEVAVKPGEDAASLWRRALAPMGVRLLLQVVDAAQATGRVPAREQNSVGVTLAPALKPHVVG